MQINNQEKSGRRRIAIVSFAWVGICFIAFLFIAGSGGRGDGVFAFLFFTILTIPVWAGWSIYWIYLGFKNDQLRLKEKTKDNEYT